MHVRVQRGSRVFNATRVGMVEQGEKSVYIGLYWPDQRSFSTILSFLSYEK